MKLRSTYLMLCLITVLTLSAQTDIQLGHYFELPTYYNPGAVGHSDYLRVRGGARMQWVGVKNAPRSFLATADTPFNVPWLEKTVGAGVRVSQERLGLYETLSAGLQLGWRFRMPEGILSVGLQGGLLSQRFRGSEIFIPDDNEYHDPADEGLPRTDLSGSALDLGAGLFYTSGGFWLGLSGMHLNSPTVTFSGQGVNDATSQTQEHFEFNARPVIYLMAGGNIPIKFTLFEIMPSMMVKSDFDTTVAEVTGRFRYRKMFIMGAGYRWKEAVSFILGAEYRGFYLGYSYEYPLSEIARVSNGSHEIVAGYNLKLDFTPKNKNRQKSIRII